MLFRVQEYNGTEQHIFAIKLDLNASELTLNEGLEVRWFKETELSTSRIAFNYKEVIKYFIKKNASHGGTANDNS
jgi:hypothetical protein